MELPPAPAWIDARTADYTRPGGAWHGLPTLDLLGEGPGVVDASSGARLTATEAQDRVGRVAAGLILEGVRKGDVVSWRIPNGEAVVTLYRACWRIGAVAAPVPHRAGPAEVEAALAQVDPVMRIDAADEVEHLAAAGAGAAVAPGASGVDPSAVAVVQFTSGSTGRPKAVIHTHLTLGYKARSMVAVHGLLPSDVVLMPAPMAHVSGLLNGVLVPAAAGMRIVTMAAWDPGHALNLIEAEKVSFMVGPPTFFVAMLGDNGYDPARVRSLRLLSCGGAGVTPAFVESTAAAFGCSVKRSYGSTEAPTVTTSYPGDPPERASRTDGRATGPVELHIEGGGELWLRGPEVCHGYMSEDDTRNKFTADGWLRTGDLATLDEGWLTITGRLSDVVIRGGENITTGEIEATLEAHPEVRQAVVVGYPDDLLGERVCAFVVVNRGARFGLEEVRVWFESRGVTRFKWPERVEIRDELPLLNSGKPDRALLRDLAARRD